MSNFWNNNNEKREKIHKLYFAMKMKQKNDPKCKKCTFRFDIKILPFAALMFFIIVIVSV